MKKTALLSLVTVLTLSAAVAFSAETKPATDEQIPPGAKLVPTLLEGKIVAADKASRLLTVEVKGTILKINVTPAVKINRNDKEATFDELAPGQAIHLSFMQLQSGRIEVAALIVEPSSEPLEPAGETEPSKPNRRKKS